MKCMVLHVLSFCGMLSSMDWEYLIIIFINYLINYFDILILNVISVINNKS